jgi:cell division protein FtsL
VARTHVFPPSLVRSTALPGPVAGDAVARRRANVHSSVSAATRRLIVWGVLLGMAGVCLLLGYVWVRLMVVEAGYRLSVTRQLVVVLEREGRELAVRAAAADSAARVEALARTRLGMRPAERGEEEFLP